MAKLQGLYAIADAQCTGSERLEFMANEVLAAGVKIIQYRDKINNYENRLKLAHKIKFLANKYQALFIINDDIKLAKSINADGIHIGKEDISIREARSILATNKIIGASCYNDLNNAKQAIKDGANYVAFGSIYTSSSKPRASKTSIELLTKAKNELSVPICAIGGINASNITPLLKANIDMFAMISALFSSTTPKQTTENYLKLIQQFDLTT